MPVQGFSAIYLLLAYLILSFPHLFYIETPEFESWVIYLANKMRPDSIALRLVLRNFWWPGLISQLGLWNIWGRPLNQFILLLSDHQQLLKHLFLVTARFRVTLFLLHKQLTSQVHLSWPIVQERKQLGVRMLVLACARGISLGALLE